MKDEDSNKKPYAGIDAHVNHGVLYILKSDTWMCTELVLNAYSVSLQSIIELLSCSHMMM